MNEEVVNIFNSEKELYETYPKKFHWYLKDIFSGISTIFEKSPILYISDLLLYSKISSSRLNTNRAVDCQVNTFLILHLVIWFIFHLIW